MSSYQVSSDLQISNYLQNCVIWGLAIPEYQKSFLPSLSNFWGFDSNLDLLEYFQIFNFLEK